MRYCPECGATMTGPMMFGEIVCDDQGCAYVMWEESTESKEN